MKTNKLGKVALRHEGGQALVEVALLTPMLLVLLLGVIEVGRYAYIGILVGNAARAGAAYGAQTSITAADTPGITSAAKNDFQNNGLDPSALTVTSSGPVCECDSGGSISPVPGGCASTAIPICTAGHEVVSLQVTAQADFSPLFHGAFGIPQVTTLSKTAKMRIGECPTCPQ
jgi:Flp pilus assembly protein TadG